MGRFSDHWKFIVLIPQFGLTIVVSVLLSAYVGYRIDEYLRMLPLFTVVFTILGIAGGLRVGWKLINRSLPRKQDGSSKKGNKK